MKAAPPKTRAQAQLVIIHLDAICDYCKVFHSYRIPPELLLHAMDEWSHKHPAERDCRVRFELATRPANLPRGFDDSYYEGQGEAPYWLRYAHNTNFQPSYRASGAVSNAIQSLATSSTWLAGYESATIDNTTNKDLDIWMSGQTTVGTTPTINTRVEHHIVTMQDDTTWPDVFDGTESAETVTSQGVKDSICVPLVFLNVDATTSNRVYPYTKRSVAALFGGLCPPKFGVFTTHNTAVNLNSTAGNQVLTQAGVMLTGT